MKALYRIAFRGIIVSLCVVKFVFAQTPEMITDINTATVSSTPIHLKNYDDKVMFYLQRLAGFSSELWKTDGTSAGTVKVTQSGDLNYSPGYGDFATTLNGVHYYVSYNTLIRTDGTEAGTSVVKTFDGGVNGAYETNGKIFITTYKAPYTGELWVSDGTTVGTVLLKTIDTQYSMSNTAYNYIQNVQVHAGEIFFATLADFDTGGCCSQLLWKSDGTSDGTVSLDTDARFYYAFVYQNSLFYFTNDGLAKNSLAYDNETIIKEMPSYGALSKFQSMESGPYMYFVIGEITSNYSQVKEELWRTDGTDAGTISLYVSDINTPIRNLTDVNGKLFFTSGYKLLKSDGSAPGTTVVKDYTIDAAAQAIYPSNLIAASDKLFFTAYTITQGEEIWTSDGTTTQIVASPESASARSVTPRNLVKFGNGIMFSGNGSLSGNELLKTDGSVVTLVKDIDTKPGGSAIENVVATKSKVYFSATNSFVGKELYVTNGTPGGATLVNDLTPSGSSDPLDIIQYRGDTILYTGFNGSKRDLYSNLSAVKRVTLDGGDNGTYLYPSRIGDYVYFPINQNSAEGAELWRTNFTSTERLTDLAAPNNGSVLYGNVVGFDNEIYFSLYDVFTPANNGFYKVDANSATGATLVKAFNPSKIVVNGNAMYFFAYDPATGNELWKSDGTTAGTVLVKDVVPGTGSSVVNFGSANEFYADYPVVFKGKLYFLASIGNQYEVWMTDGTEAGTSSLGVSSAGRLTVAGDKLFFSGEQGVYVSDGTHDGTTRVTNDNSPFQFLAFNNQLVYSSNGKLKLSDGTAQGTQTIASFTGGTPFWTTHVGSTLFFAADDNIHGLELWKLTLPEPPAITSFQQDAVNRQLFTITGELHIRDSRFFCRWRSGIIQCGFRY